MPTLTTPPAAASAPTAVVDSVLSALVGVGRSMRQPVPGDDAEPTAFWLLKSIADLGPVRITELASCTQLDASTVSRQVAQLDRAGLVERTADPADGRAHRISLTATGRTRLHRALGRRRKLLHRALDHWGVDDVALLERLLNRLVGDLDTRNVDLEKP